MSDSLILIIAIVLAAILMFIVPLMSISERNDDITQLAVQTATSDFVETATTKGKITQDDYSAFVQTLAATGNTYEIEMEVQVIDENFGKKSASTSGDLIGENSYFSVYTSTIEDKFREQAEAPTPVKNPVYPLKQGDNFIVTVKNTNKTIAQLLRGFFYTVAGNDTYQVAASYSSTVTSNGN
ncbi:MAG: hypothetical protein IJN50_06150 [Clostridia bacterium]|nr:hypothetical protein [Clostridia bacterium]